MPTLRDIPEAWPLLLTREQLCAYLGGLSWSTLTKILPVPPVDLGANVLRYNRPEIDAWAATLPPRLPKALQQANDDQRIPETEPDAPESRTLSAVDRARQRALGGARWRKSRTSSGSGAQTAA